MIQPLEKILPTAERDRVRSQTLAKYRFYNPWVHLGITSGFGGAVIVLGFVLIHDVKWWQVLFGLGLLILSNATEWRIHKGLLHRRFKLAPFLYDRHTPEHHVIYITDDMAVRTRKEWALVLIPPWGIIMLFVALLPAMAMIWYGWPFHLFSMPDQHNIACVFAIETMFYVVSYEWLHLSYHQPADSFVGRLWLVRVLRRHHAVHHDPRLMQKWNFNVNLPLWDYVRGTVVKERPPVESPASADAKA